MTLMSWLTSCVTNHIDAPELRHLEKPAPYDAEGNMVLKAVGDDTVQMPMWYWRQVYNYIIDADTNQKLYEDFINQ